MNPSQQAFIYQLFPPGDQTAYHIIRWRSIIEYKWKFIVMKSGGDQPLWINFAIHVKLGKCQFIGGRNVCDAKELDQ